MDFINQYGMVSMTIITAVIMGLAQVAKSLGLNSKFIPLFNLAAGITLCVLVMDLNLKLRVFNGILAGLSASGLYTTQKHVYEGINGPNQQ